MRKDDILELINIATKLKRIKNNDFFLIKGMIIERSLNKKDCN
ncbi:hypothetical protein [Paraclostridium sordellii]|nr:hypothetical protein [Paeniclostridium sordellii]